MLGTNESTTSTTDCAPGTGDATAYFRHTDSATSYQTPRVQSINVKINSQPLSDAFTYKDLNLQWWNGNTQRSGPRATEWWHHSHFELSDQEIHLRGGAQGSPAQAWGFQVETSGKWGIGPLQEFNSIEWQVATVVKLPQPDAGCRTGEELPD